MSDLVVAVALALTLGLVVGLGVGALRGYRTAGRQQAVAGMNIAMARLWPTELPERSAADIIAGRVKVVLGGAVYDLPVLPRAASRAWVESLDSSFGSLLTDLEQAGNDTPAILSRILGYQDQLWALLASYDTSGVLPPRGWVDEFATDAEVFRAVVEVWRAANPLAATLAGMASRTPGTSPEEPSSSPAPTAGTLASSRSS